ncbi:cuticle protein 18.6-like [Penaeus monodon]|uniref:cuticle protein 18.6-like n=1 Tax=Penaeus monodon TaxID=6687 RepID=UPI0018A717C7|nr:cuticle protein 18.6-like [Penaeus monodon]
MSLKVVVLACVVVVALCDKTPVHAPHPPVYASKPSYHAPAPYHAPEPAYHAPEPAYHAPEPAYHAPEPYEPEYADVPPKYNYNYGVADTYSGANFAASESRDGYNTEGTYTVDLPTAASRSSSTWATRGYVAEVTYERRPSSSSPAWLSSLCATRPQSTPLILPSTPLSLLTTPLLLTTHLNPAYHAPEPAYHAPEPAYHAPEPAYHAPKHYEPEYADVTPKYNYNYGVANTYSGANFAASESRDGYNTEGTYTVDLPDGRKQIVNYVDNGDGYVAQVTYEGEAQYPEYKPTYKPASPTPAYA